MVKSYIPEACEGGHLEIVKMLLKAKVGQPRRIWLCVYIYIDYICMYIYVLVYNDDNYTNDHNHDHHHNTVAMMMIISRTASGLLARQRCSAVIIQIVMIMGVYYVCIYTYIYTYVNHITYVYVLIIMTMGL